MVYLVLAVVPASAPATATRHGREGRRLLLQVELGRGVLDPRVLRTERHTGDLLSVTTTDAEYTSYLLDHIPRITSALVAVTVSAVALLLISPPLGLTVLVAIPIVLAILNLTAPLIARRVKERQDQAGRATALATDLVTGLRPLRIGAQDAGAARYRPVSRRSLAAALARLPDARTRRPMAISEHAGRGLVQMASWLRSPTFITDDQFITVIDYRLVGGAQLPPRAGDGPSTW